MTDDEIKISDQVLNLDIYDSDEEDEEDLNFEDLDFDSRKRSDSVDELSEENALVLGNLLEEVATTQCCGKNEIRIELYNTKDIEFLPKNEKIDLDNNELGYPYLPSGGEEFILPFLQKLKSIRKELKGTKIVLNVPNMKFNF